MNYTKKYSDWKARMRSKAKSGKIRVSTVKNDTKKTAFNNNLEGEKLGTFEF
jgi:hypothetical protein